MTDISIAAALLTVMRHQLLCCTQQSLPENLGHILSAFSVHSHCSAQNYELGQQQRAAQKNTSMTRGHYADVWDVDGPMCTWKQSEDQVAMRHTFWLDYANPGLQQALLTWNLAFAGLL